MLELIHRLRRNRRNSTIRNLLQETHIHPQHLVWPVFVLEGKNKKEPIPTMPGIYRWSLDLLIPELKRASKLGLNSIALFPFIEVHLKDASGTYAINKDNLVTKAIQEIKNSCPGICLFSDLALDPFTTHGHDGLLDPKTGDVQNDPTVAVLTQMAVLHALAGADYVAPSDMMDGRVGAIRKTLDQNGFSQTGIMAYSAKYASAFYGPFREAVGSKQLQGDKKSYQLSIHNTREALREVEADIWEGADIVMVKPALSYLDIISQLRQKYSVPIASYNVSGEYAMVKAAAQQGWVDEKKMVNEILISLRRGGSDLIFTYHAMDYVQWF
ncbi:MAG: porphobilinogen synthase [Bdellovibrionales bacterium]|nr:porphobilinogen synthase [Bdellovibrionales bacterium]